MGPRREEEIEDRMSRGPGRTDQEKAGRPRPEEPNVNGRKGQKAITNWPEEMKFPEEITAK